MRDGCPSGGPSCFGATAMPIMSATSLMAANTSKRGVTHTRVTATKARERWGAVGHYNSISFFITSFPPFHILACYRHALSVAAAASSARYSAGCTQTFFEMETNEAAPSSPAALALPRRGPLYAALAPLRDVLTPQRPPAPPLSPPQLRRRPARARCSRNGPCSLLGRRSRRAIRRCPRCAPANLFDFLCCLVPTSARRLAGLILQHGRSGGSATYSLTVL